MAQNYLLIVGTSGHSRCLYDLAHRLGYKPWLQNIYPSEIAEISIILPNKVPTKRPIPFIVGIGSNFQRMTIFNSLINETKLKPISLIDKSSSVSPFAKVGIGSVVMPQSVIGAGVEIKSNCVINSGAIIEHDCTMQDHSSIAPRSVICGESSIGFCSFVGAGVIINEKIQIGNHTFIGSGSTVVSNIPSSVLAYGSPAKIRRPRTHDEIHLV